MAKQKQSKDPEKHLGRNVAMGAAAVAPFAGMIGQKPLHNDPLVGENTGKKFKTLDELSRHAQPGDIVITNKGSEGPFKKFITPMTGSEFYHAQPVVGRRRGHGLTTDIGMIGKHNRTVPDMLKDTFQVKTLKHDYDDVVLLRPKKPLTAKQLEVFNREALHRARLDPGYDVRKAVGVWTRDVFVPKIKGFTGTGNQFSQSKKDLVQSIDKKTFTVKGAPRSYSYCSGNVCSTAPAQAYTKATGRHVLPGKAAKDMFPTDFLRSEEYEVVGAHLKPKKHWHKVVKAVGPYAVRAGLGVAGAGAVYTASKHPDETGGLTGAVAASHFSTRLNRHYATSHTAAQMRIPGLEEVVRSHIKGSDLETAVGPEGSRKYLTRWLTRKVPIIAAGGAAGYYGTKTLREYINHADRNK